MDYFFYINIYIYLYKLYGEADTIKIVDVFRTIDTSATAIDALDLRVDALDLRVDALDLRVDANATTIATARGADMLQYLVNSSSNIEINNDAIITICNNTTGTWTALGTGLNNDLNGFVTSLAVDSTNNVYVGGNFTTAGDQSANRIAMWNPHNSTWTALGTGLNNGFVTSLAVDSTNNVYVGGNFATAGGQSANYIAMWNPRNSTWTALLGTGVNGIVNSLAVDSTNNVYVGGNFTTAGGQSAKYISKLDTNTFFDITINNNYVTTLSCQQYQCVNYYKANNRFYNTFNGYL